MNKQHSLSVKRIAQLLLCLWCLGLHSLALAQTTFDAPVQINGQLVVGGDVSSDLQISADGETVVYRADLSCSVCRLERFSDSHFCVNKALSCLGFYEVE